MSKSKSKDKAKPTTPEKPQVQETTPIEETPPSKEEPEPQEPSSTIQEPASESTMPQEPSQTPAPLPTRKQIQRKFLIIKQLVLEHSDIIIDLQQNIARKRKPVALNGKVQIRDKQTNIVYPSKNNDYQSLLKSGALKELVDKGVFGEDHMHNTFGLYTLVHEGSGGFEEVYVAGRLARPGWVRPHTLPPVILFDIIFSLSTGL